MPFVGSTARPSVHSRSHHHFLMVLMAPLPTLSSSLAMKLRVNGNRIAAHNTARSASTPSVLNGHVFMHRPHAAPFWLPNRYLVHFSTSGFHISAPLNMILSPKGIAPQGHSRAHLVHFEQKSCSPKSTCLSATIGMSVVTTTDLNRGPTKGFRTSSPIRLSSPNPACNTSGT